MTPTRMPILAPALALAFFIHGCASPPPKEPFDPLTQASVYDTADGGGSAGGTKFFMLVEVNGKTTGRTSQSASMQASRGMGMSMRTLDVERPVAAGKVRLKLRGLVGHAAPIQGLFAAAFAGGPREVEGTIDVELKPDARYRVTGAIDELRSEVWLEEVGSNALVGTKIAAAPTAEAKKAATADAFFTCCNFRHDSEGWISDANWIEQTLLPAGTPIRVYDYGRNRAKVSVNGRPMWLGLDYGRDQQTTQQLVAKLAVKDDPAPRIAAYPDEVQAAIRAGKVVPGMTKEQVIVALGYPRTDLTRSIELPRWTYRSRSDVDFALVWGADERLVGIEAPAELRALVVHAP
jgi:hypothetical protein